MAHRRRIALLAFLGVFALLPSSSALGQMFSDQTDPQKVNFKHVTVFGDQLHMGAGGAWGDY